VRATPETVLRLLSITAAVALLALVASMPVGMAGCANQGEGDRCTLFGGADAGENGTSECSAGLLCVSAAMAYPNTGPMTPGAGTLGICCPPSGAPATGACVTNPGGSMTAGPPIGDGGSDGDTGANADGSRDSAKDGPHAPPDARTDAESRDATHDGTAAHDATTQG